jgi:CheY-like chemotaxis protein
MDRTRILYIDDSHDTAELIRDMLNMMDITVDIATHGDNVVALAHHHGSQVVVINVYARLDTFLDDPAFKKLRYGSAVTRHIPVIFIMYGTPKQLVLPPNVAHFIYPYDITELPPLIDQMVTRAERKQNRGEKPYICRPDCSLCKEVQETTMNKRRILVVSDDPAVNNEIRHHLLSLIDSAGNQKYDVAASTRRDDYLAQAYQQMPDVIILDTFLDAKEVAIDPVYQVLRQATHTGNIPIVFLVLNDSRERRHGSLETEMDDYVIKPLDVELVALVTKNTIDRVERENRTRGGQ